MFKRWYHSEAGREYYERKRNEKNEQHKKYRQSEKGKIVQRNKAKRMRLKYPEKWSARAKVRYAVKVGKLEKLACAVCGDIKSSAHHEDYSKPLEVVWLCGQHHRERHVEIELLNK